MKAINFILIGFMSAVFTNSDAQNTWTQISSFLDEQRSDAVSFVIGDKAYVGTGFSNPNLTNDFWEYDPNTNTWTQKADFAGLPRSSAVGFSIGGKGYLGTGIVNWNGDIYTNDFWEYDPNTNTWTKKTKLPGGVRGGAIGLSINSKGYIGTGLDGGTFQEKKDFWEYDPATDDWTKKADLPGSIRVNAVGFTIANKGYVGTGSSNGSPTKDFWEYDPVTNSWIQKADFGGLVRTGASGFSIGDKGYIGTGSGSSGNAKDFWEYDPVINGWTQKADFEGTARYQAIGFSIAGKGYIGLGQGQFDFWQYTPDCTTPMGFTTTNIKPTSAKVNWNIVANAQTYSVRYRKSGTTQWTKITAPLNYKKLTGLTPNTQYDWTVKSVCDAVNNVSSDWSAIQNFTTKPLKLDGENDDEEISFEVFPNPTSTTITLSLPSSQNAILSIFNLLGEKVKEEKVTGKQVTLDVSSLPQGLYLVRMENGVVGKFVKE